jgi:hypothetical protein
MESLEASEFIQLNSTCDYRLPMAHLNEKGMKFTSPLVVYSTNDDYVHVLNKLEKQLSCREAISRRIKYFVTKKKSSLDTMD